MPQTTVPILILFPDSMKDFLLKSRTRFQLFQTYVDDLIIYVPILIQELVCY